MIPENYGKYDEFMEILHVGIKCGFCSNDLSEDNVEMYDHEGGIPVMGHLEKQWVFVRCSNQQCLQAWSWNKIIKRGKAMGLLSKLP